MKTGWAGDALCCCMDSLCAVGSGIDDDAIGDDSASVVAPVPFRC